MITGYEAKWDCTFRVTGATGMLELLYTRPMLRVRSQGDSDWRFKVIRLLHDRWTGSL